MHYVLDKQPNFIAEWLDELSLHSLYKNDEIFFTQSEDVRRFAVYLKKFKSAIVVVDDYRLCQEWEQSLKELSYWLVVIDDLRRPHVADILIEPKLESLQDTRAHSKDCLLLTGPRYSLLDDAYCGITGHRDTDSFIVLLSLGGGGDMEILNSCMKHILEEYVSLSSNSNLPRLILKPVVGPMGDNANCICELANRYPENVFPIEQPEKLAPHYQQASLFVGAAGTSIYEAAASKVPAMTFAIAENQYNELSDLESLGHYLHINEELGGYTKALGLLIVALIFHGDRLKYLRKSADVVIDGYGAERVAHQITLLAAKGSRTASAADCEMVIATPGTPKNDTHGAVTDFSVRRCDDTDINRYLHARNLPANRCNMTTDAAIHPLFHYRWWFLTNRHSYVVSYKRESVLYIWHEVVNTALDKVLVGGWFSAAEKPDLMCVVEALDWQLQRTDADFCGVPWVAIIRKSNQFVYQLNQRAGFKDAEPGSFYYAAISEYFNEANPEDFYYVYRLAKSEIDT